MKFNCGCNESQKLPLSLYALLFSTGFVEIKPNNLVYQTKQKTGCRKICFASSEINRHFF